ncbi:MAG: ATP-binding protein [Cellulomonadaceae bacterium]
MSNEQRPSAPARPAPRPPLRRPEEGRWIGGVALGLAGHLEVPVRWVRLAFVALGTLGGVGVLLYVFWWVTVPTSERGDDPVRGAPRLRVAPLPGVRAVPVRDMAIGVMLLVGALLVVATRFGARIGWGMVLPVLLGLAGLALAWSQLDGVERGRLLSRAAGRTPFGVLRLAGGLVLVLLGVLLLVGQDEPFALLAQSGVAALAMLAGVALVLAPWWIRLTGQLRLEREARARESERADIAAHLHDSVLQTLALIRTGAGEPERVARLARAQERELREWLYDDRPAAGTSIAAELRTLVGEVEDGRAHGSEGAPAMAIDTVVVGDCAPTPDTTALLQATREALVNAVAHGAPPISLYLEVGAEHIEVFVRDRGPGFDIDAIAPDRFGVRESILGRVRRRGGAARITSSPERGTEIQLRLPRTEGEHP